MLPYKMYICVMKYQYILFLSLGLSFFGCKNDSTEKQETVTEHEFADEDEDLSLPLEERAEKQARKKLGIPTNEKISIKLHNAYLNGDNQTDALITINRLEYAENYCKPLKHYEVLKKNGFVGNYNYIMIHDGASNKLSIPVPVPSSAMKELDVDFEYIFSESFVTPVVSYRIKNAEFKNFYNIADGILNKVFKMKSYDYVGEKNQEAFSYVIQETGMFGPVKDITVYKAIIENEKELAADWFGVNPKIKKTNILDKKWFYDAKRAAFVTPE